MVEWVKNLLELQEVDMRIKAMEKRLELIPGERTSRKSEIKDAEAELKVKREELNRNSMEIKKIESEVRQRNDAASRLSQQSNMVKKNTEYQALLKEIADVKAAVSELETREIELLDKVEEDNAAYREIEKQYKVRMQSCHDEMTELDQMVSEINEELAKLKAARAPFVSKLEADVLNIYNRLLPKAGQPLVMVTAGNCGHCHMKLIPQTLHNVQKGAVTICDQCAHLLYM